MTSFAEPTAYRVKSAGVVALDEGVDPLPGAFEVAGCLAHAHVLFSDGFNDREVGVVVAHGQLLLAECVNYVNYVATDLPTIIRVAGWGKSVNDVLTDLSTASDKNAGRGCQLSPDAGHHHRLYAINQGLTDG